MDYHLVTHFLERFRGTVGKYGLPYSYSTLSLQMLLFSIAMNNHVGLTVCIFRLSYHLQNNRAIILISDDNITKSTFAYALWSMILNIPIPG